MIVNFCNTNYECHKAIKGPDYVHLLNEDGIMVASFDGVKDFSVFTLSGGNWTEPTPENQCYIAVIGDDGVIRKGSHTCDDITPYEIKTVNKGRVKIFAGTQEEWDALEDKTNIFPIDSSNDTLMSLLSRAIADEKNGTPIKVWVCESEEEFNEITKEDDTLYIYPSPNTEITKDDKGVIKVGDIVMPYKKLIWKGTLVADTNDPHSPPRYKTIDIGIQVNPMREYIIQYRKMQHFDTQDYEHKKFLIHRGSATVRFYEHTQAKTAQFVTHAIHYEQGICNEFGLLCIFISNTGTELTFSGIAYQTSLSTDSVTIEAIYEIVE